MIHNFDPILFDLGFIQVRWYSLAYVFGILFGWWYGRGILKLQIVNSDQKKYTDNFDDLVGYLIIGIIFGGRLGYVIFYNPLFYLENFTEIFKLWKGGMSFHGGLLGVILATYFFSRIKKLNFKIYFDTISCVAPIGIFFGRIANFINSELYGYETSVPWAVQFIQVDNLYRHPSQLYEAALEGVVLFTILLFFWKKNFLEKTGKLSALFLIIYSFFRFIIEYFRIPDEQLGYILFNLTIGQIMSIVFCLLGVVLLFIKNDSKKKS